MMESRTIAPSILNSTDPSSILSKSTTADLDNGLFPSTIESRSSSVMNHAIGTYGTEGGDANHEIVQAYAKLDFGSKFAYYIQTLDVIIGRQAGGIGTKPTNEMLSLSRPHQSLSKVQRSTTSDHAELVSRRGQGDDKRRVDIDLGRLKSISRQHARLAYDFDTETWHLHVIGKNGVLVADRFYGKGEVAPLEDEMTVQICEIMFTFRLPQTEEVPQSESITDNLGPEEGTLEKRRANTDPVKGTMATGQKGKADRPSKPPHSYVTLIYRAISSTPDRKATLSQICILIAKSHGYYTLRRKAWQKSISQILASTDCFRKVTKGESSSSDDEWEVDPAHESDFKNNAYRRRRRTALRPQDAVRTNPAPLSTKDGDVLSEEQKRPHLAATHSLEEHNSAQHSRDRNASHESELGPKMDIRPHKLALLKPNTNTLHSTAEDQNVHTSSSRQKKPPAPANPLVISKFDTNANRYVFTSVLQDMTDEPIEIAMAKAVAVSLDPQNPPPPLARRGRVLILDSSIFKHLSASQLAHLRKLSAKQAVQLLQEYYDISRKGALEQIALSSSSNQTKGSSSATHGISHMQNDTVVTGTSSNSQFADHDPRSALADVSSQPLMTLSESRPTSAQSSIPQTTETVTKPEVKVSLQDSLLALARLPSSKLPKGVTPAALNALLKMHGLTRPESKAASRSASPLVNVKTENKE